MKRIAVIDIGTNTINLLIIEELHKGYTILYNKKIAAKLGAGGIDKKEITPEAFERGFTALEEHLSTINSYNVAETLAFATASLRIPTNGVVFAQEVKKLFDLDIDIISGEKEAELIYLGVKQSEVFGPNSSLIIDIGGGSVEFIYCNEEGVQWMKSFDIGVSLLFETFKPGDPISKKEQDAIGNFLEESLEELWSISETYPTEEIVGASGSFDTLSAIMGAKEASIYNLQKVLTLFLELNCEERMKIPNMDPSRVEYMPLVSILISLVAEKLKIKDVKYSPFALKEGVINVKI